MRNKAMFFILILITILTGCSSTKDNVTQNKDTVRDNVSIEDEGDIVDNVVKIELSNNKIFVNNEEVTENAENPIYKANDVIFYLEDQGIEYGEGVKFDEHSQIEANAHTVLHITEPGIYEVSGTMDAGQIFVDLGEEVENDPSKVVKLILNNVDITCTVAPAIFFCSVYECAEKIEIENENIPIMNIDTSAAGANIEIADGSSNKIYGSYVANIFESCELNEDGTEIVNSKTLHKYDGAIFSKDSINISGTGKLEVIAENKGICSDMHMTISGGNIKIKSNNDGINVNEENISVFTMNDGILDIQVSDKIGEGDGIDSNGQIIINGGTIDVSACAISEESGLDSNNGVYINGGTVLATGNVNPKIIEGKQTSILFKNDETLEDGKKYRIKDIEEDIIMDISPKNKFSTLIVSTENINVNETYVLWLDDMQLVEGVIFGAVDAGVDNNINIDVMH